MEINNKLEEVRKELNHLYTEPPKQAPNGGDAGFFCREHAFHLYLISKYFGWNSEIVHGDYVIKTENYCEKSLGDPDGHYWCKINAIAPVDLSINLKYRYLEKKLDHHINGIGINGDFEVTLFDSEQDFKFCIYGFNSISKIGYFEKNRLKYSASELIRNPHCFLYDEGLNGWSNIHGKDVYAKVTSHLIKVYKCAYVPLYKSTTPIEAIRIIAKREQKSYKEFVNKLT